MRILLLSEVFPPRTGGSGRWFCEIYSRLARQDFLIVVDEHPDADEFDSQHELDLVRWPLHFSQWGIRSRRGLADYFRLWRRLGGLMKRRHVDTIHAARCLPEGWLAWLLKHTAGIRYVVYVHGEEVEYASSSRELTWMVGKVIRGAEYLICNSHNTRKILDKWQVDADKIRIMHPGVDTSYFVPAERNAKRRQELGWEDRPVVMTAGRLQRRKGHDVLIQAISRIRSEIPDVLLAICGDGEERERLVDLAREHDVDAHVQFLGEVDDDRLVQCYQQCDLFVLANRRVGEDIEGFGIVLVEAQACGKPVIAGASGGTAETMDASHTGLLVDCRQPEPLASEITKLLLEEDRRCRMGLAARQWVERNYDWKMLAAEADVLFRTGVLPNRDSLTEAALTS